MFQPGFYFLNHVMYLFYTCTDQAHTSMPNGKYTRTPNQHETKAVFLHLLRTVKSSASPQAGTHAHLQYSSLRVERFHSVNLVEDCPCVHQHLPDVVMVPPAK